MSKKVPIKILRVLAMLLSALYLLATGFAGYLLICEDIEQEDKLSTAKGSNTPKSQKFHTRLLWAPLMGVAFTVTAIVIFFESLALKIRSIFF